MEPTSRVWGGLGKCPGRQNGSCYPFVNWDCCIVPGRIFAHIRFIGETGFQYDDVFKRLSVILSNRTFRYEDRAALLSVCLR